jgi:hypothetical protein
MALFLYKLVIIKDKPIFVIKFKLDMKKLIICILFIINVAVLSSCERDRCPAHGGITPSEQPNRA